MSNLTILNTPIRQIDNLFSLNELHKVSGNEDKHRPAFFIRLDTTKELIAEIQQEDPTAQVILCKNGIGTYASEELALAYAMWISPKFHLIVLRAFLAMHKQQSQPKQLTLPEPEQKYSRELTKKQWLRFVSLWFALYNNLELMAKIHKPLELLGSRHGTTAYSYATEYQTTLGVAKRLLEPMLAEFEVDPYDEPHFHLALKTLREYQPKGLGAGAKI